MKSREIYLRSISIHRAPGVERSRGFTLDGLSSRINLVHGPNGAGKTTTARMLQELFRPGEFFSGFVSARGEFVWSDRKWLVEIEGKNADWYCEGRKANPPEFGHAQQGRGYYLGLDELIREDDRGFAKQLADAAQGGFDLRAAAEALQYRENPPSRTRYRNEVEKLRKNVWQAQKNQQLLDERAARLQELQDEKSRARSAARELEELWTVRECKLKQSEISRLGAKLDAFPRTMDVLSGDEPERLKELKREKRDTEQEIDQYTRQLEQARQQMQQSGLPQGGVDRNSLNSLEVLAGKIQDLDREISQLSRERDKAANQEEAVRSRLRSAISGPDLQVLASVEIKDLGGLAREADKLRARRQVLQERKNWLSGNNSCVVDPWTVQNGLANLSGWLKSGRERSSRPWMLSLLALLTVLPSVLLAWTYHPAWWLAALLAPVLAWLSVRGGSKTSRDAENYKSAYLQLDLPLPQDWTPREVTRTMDELYELLASSELEREKSARLKALHTEEYELEQREAELGREVKGLEQSLGISLDIGEEWLSLLADNISRWQQASEETSRADGALENARSQFEDKLQEFNARIGAYGYEPVETAQQCRAAVTDLLERKEEFEKAKSSMEFARQMIEQSLRPALQRVEQGLEDMFAKLGLESGDENALNRMVDRLPEYMEIKNELQEKSAVLENLKSQLTDCGASRLDMSLSEIDGLVQEKKKLAEMQESIVQEITSIQKDIDRAKAGGEVASAVARLQQAEEELQLKCEQDVKSVAGSILTGYVRKKTAESSRPAVFYRASELLGKITKGRYRLEIEEDSEPGFLALDQVNGRVKDLEELSTGERVQLLLAVRLAFVEHEERDARLPLLMDETLGNADEERAYAIIRAVIQIAGDGRQVFYFSAQPEEISKWRHCLESEGMDCAIMDLARSRREEEAANIPLQQPEPNPVPLPGGCTHGEYGYLLDVPGLDPLRQNVGEVHLWHVLEDPQELYKLLSLGISRVGQVYDLVDSDAEKVLSAAGVDKQGLQAGIRALESCFAAYRIGRAPAVDREVLQDSGAVSDTFISELSRLADKLDGSAEELISALENGRVPRWRANKTQELEQYLQEQGYLDPRSPLGQEELGLELAKRVSTDIEQGLLQVEWIRRTVAKLF